MSPPLPVTEDTPPDMLAGSMDLRVVLPSGHNVKMSVDRSTPMMDLLVQVTTANKISPGGHVIQALGERGVLPYKPSTPIGALDTWTIHIVSKNQIANSGIKKAPLKPVNQPFEQTFRLQVHLPRNQLYVSRVSPKARLSDILLQVCSEKNLDPSRYSLRHPTNLEQVLNLKCTLADYKLQEVTLVYNTSLPVEVSTVDIMSLQRDTSNPAYNNYINRNNRSCEGSVSSGSLGGRSLSPVPSDESSASPPPPPPSRPVRKRRPAPKPPTINNTNQLNGVQKESETSKSTTVICHSRNSSDSSGYHEASVLSESPQSNSLPDSLPRRSKLPSITSESEITETNLEVNNTNLSRSLSSLTAVENTAAVGMRQYQHSISTSSLSTVGGRKKKAAPPPPPTASKMSSLKEEQQRTPSVSSTASSTTTLDGNEATAARKSATLPPLGRIPSITTVEAPENIPSSPVDACSLETPESPAQVSTTLPKPAPRSVSKESSPPLEKPAVKYRAPLPKPRHILHESKSIEEKREIVESVLHRSQSDSTTIEVKSVPVQSKRNVQFSSLQKSHKALIDELAGKLKKPNGTEDEETSSSDSTITNNSDNVQDVEPTSATSSASSVFFSSEVLMEKKLKETLSDADLLNKTKIDSTLERNISVSCLQEANSMSTEPSRLGRWRNIECLVDTKKEQTAWVLGSQTESSPLSTNNENSELRLADEEIDRIFHNATRDHTSLESGVGDEPPLSLSSLPSPPASLTHKDIDTSQNTDPLDWEYKLPAPPTFRDESNSPPVTEYGTLTIGNLTQVFGQPSLVEVVNERKEELEKIVEEDKSVLKEKSINENIIVEIHNKIGENKTINTKETMLSKTSSQTTISKETSEEKKAVINELSNVISERLSRPETNIEPINKSSSDSIAPSTLDNFTITTYKDTKPIEVFEDESIKSSVGEKRDTSKDDALFRAPKARIAEPNLTRTNSFTTEEKSYHPTVKRSVSYVSLLAANMPRTSQPYRAHLAKSNLALTENGNDTLLQKEVWPRLRKTSSELNISREASDQKNLLDDHSTSWQNSETQSSDLQSLQVLRSILPQLSQSQNNTDITEVNNEPLDEPDRVTSISKMKIESTLVENQADLESKLENSRSIENRLIHVKTQRSFSVDDVKAKKETLYKYSGPPTINLSTWSERPKRQVSIKNDQDYVIGVGKKQSNNEENQIQNVEVVKETAKEIDQSNITMRLVSRTNLRTERPKSAIDLGHVPIVRAVELKKPYIGSNVGLGYLQPGKQEYSSPSEESFAGVNSLAQRFGQSKPRPVSSYLFGTESQLKTEDARCNVKNQTGVSKVVLNAGKKFTSIVGINGPESKTEVKMTGDKQTSHIHIGGFEERKLKLNTALPNKIDYTSSSDIKALSKIRSGGIVDPSSPIDALSKQKFPEPSSNKSSVTEPVSPTSTTNTSVSPNVVNPRSWKSSTISRSSSSSSNPLSPNLVSPGLRNSPTTPTSSKTDVFFGSNTLDRNTKVRPNNFPLPVVKGFRINSDSDSSGGIPPPPPVMPVLKSVGLNKGYNTLPPPGKDPRDQLLESIRSFGRDGLKKVSK